MARLLRTHRQPRRGFTLVELLVVIAVTGTLASAFLPLLTDARMEANRIMTHSRQITICQAMYVYEQKNGTFPSDLGTLIEAESLSGFETTLDGQIVASGHVFELTFSKPEISEHILELDSLGDFGEEAATHLRGLDTDFLIYARPFSPGRSGCLLHYMGMDCLGLKALDPDCVELEVEMLQRIQNQSLRVAATALIADPEAAGGVLPFVRSEEVKQGAFDSVDTDSDGKVTFGDLRELAKSPSAAARNSESNDAPQTLLREFLRYVLYDELQIGAGGEEIDNIGVTFDELSGDPAAIFSSANYGRLIHGLVDKKGVARGLTAKIRAAEWARLRWELGDTESNDAPHETCAHIIEAFRHQLWAQDGNSIRLDDALLWDAAVGVLCPEVEELLE